jgi:alkane 1-monooxygenase
VRGSLDAGDGPKTGEAAENCADRRERNSVFIGYFGPFCFLAVLPVLGLSGVLAPLSILPALIIFLLIGEALPWRRFAGPKRHDRLAYRLLPWFYIPSQLGVLVWGAAMAADPARDLSSIVVLGLTIGLCCGIFGVLAAHEMVHSRSRAEQALGQILLASMCYRHFRIAHVYGHHRFAGTPQDAATARKSESAYAFLVRSVLGQVTFAYQFECRRLKGRRLGILRHRLHQDAVCQILLYGTFLVFQPRIALFLALESVFAILVLEMFNYVAHYGLERRIGPDGRPERLTAYHSWNGKGAFANALIFNMGRHSDHHFRPTEPYQNLEPMPAVPELPGGYAGAILLAFVPPLWRQLMDPKVESWMNAVEPGKLTAY